MSREKKRRLESAVASIHHLHGPQALRKARDLPKQKTPPHISTTFTQLDEVTGCSGIPLNAVTLLSGKTTSGKTPTIVTDLPKLDALEQTLWEHELLGYAPDTQLLTHYRAMLRQANVLSTWQVKQAKSGQRVLVAGMIVIRQRPQTANGILFISLEDESGLLDLVVKPNVYEQFRSVLRREHLIVASGVVQKEGKAVSVLVQDVRRFGGRME